MAAESRKEPEPEPVEALIDDLIRNILSDSSTTPKTAAHSPLAALIETAMAAPPRATSSRGSMLERLLFAQTIAAALADALAPAIAEAVTPEIMKALEHYSASEPGGKGRASAAVAAGESTRKAEVK